MIPNTYHWKKLKRYNTPNHAFELWAYAIMPDHIHLLIWPDERGNIVPTVLHSVKGLTASKYKEHLILNTQESYDVYCIESNPVRADLVSHPDEWRWSSAWTRGNNHGLMPDDLNIPMLMKSCQHDPKGSCHT